MQKQLHGTILIVDDEEGMRSLLEALLESVDLPYLTAPTARSAIEQLSKNKDRVTACLLDMNLDDRPGELVYDELVRISPDLAVFPMSGIHGEEIRARLGNRKIAGLIVKPFSASGFLETLQRGFAEKSKA